MPSISRFSYTGSETSMCGLTYSVPAAPTENPKVPPAPTTWLIIAPEPAPPPDPTPTLRV